MPVLNNPRPSLLDRLDFYIVAGPTGVGKSEVAAALAERCDGEIVGADAFQIYRGLDLLTAKPAANLLGRVRHHLIGEVPLTQAFDTGQYLAAARQRIAEIRGRGRLPIIAGGTGLYIRALIFGLADLPSANPELRRDLESEPLESLQEQYSKLDPLGFARIDRQNARRLVRAIEVCILAGKPFSSFRQQWDTPVAKCRGVACTRLRAELRARIDARTQGMFEEGVEDEVRNCGQIGPTASQTLGLSEIQKLLREEISSEACIATIQLATHRYAKRQETWLRREPSLKPLTLAETGAPEEIAERLLRDLEP